MLTTVYVMIEGVNPGEGGSPDLSSSAFQPGGLADRVRTSSLVRLVARWPVEYLTTAHPFFIWMMLPTNYTSEEGGYSETFVTMVKLILDRFGIKWRLAAEAHGEIQYI
jgi:hypothetical protein